VAPVGEGDPVDDTLNMVVGAVAAFEALLGMTYAEELFVETAGTEAFCGDAGATLAAGTGGAGIVLLPGPKAPLLVPLGPPFSMHTLTN
jgi:hypothetical protein